MMTIWKFSLSGDLLNLMILTLPAWPHLILFKTSFESKAMSYLYLCNRSPGLSFRHITSNRGICHLYRMAQGFVPILPQSHWTVTRCRRLSWHPWTTDSQFGLSMGSCKLACESRPQWKVLHRAYRETHTLKQSAQRNNLGKWCLRGRDNPRPMQVTTAGDQVRWWPTTRT